MKFCTNCGEKLPDPTPKFCPNCGFNLSEESDNTETTATNQATTVMQPQKEQPEEATTNSTTQPEPEMEFTDKLNIFTDWIKHNPVLSIVVGVIVLVILLRFSTFWGFILALAALIGGFYYSNQVGRNDTSADEKLKASLNKAKTTVQSTTNSVAKKANEMNRESKNNVTDPGRRTTNTNIMLVLSIIVLLTSYVGQFVSGDFMGISGGATLFNGVRLAANYDDPADYLLLVALAIGPAIIILAALFRKYTIAAVGAIINAIIYATVFIVAYQEMGGNGFDIGIANAGYGASAIIAIILSIILLIQGLINFKK